MRFVVIPKGTQKAVVEFRAGLPQILYVNFNAVRSQQFERLFEATAWQRQVIPMQRRAGDDSRLAKCRQAHRLCPVKLRILKCRQSNKQCDHGRWKRRTIYVDVIRQDNLDAVRQWFRYALG